jgi:GT2 family glycosyltransferase
MNMELSIIFVNWNSVDYLTECIASIYQNARDITFEIIVVDNASPQGGVETLQEQFRDVKIIKSPANVGFAKANNMGFEQSQGSYVLFLNPDTLLLGPTLNILLQRMKSLPDAGIVGCKMLNTDRTVQITSIQRFPTILNQVITAEYLQLRWPNCPLWSIGPLFSSEAKVVKVEVIPGACMLLRREVFAQVGMFSEDYFMYAEDLDLNYKLKRAGYTNYYIGETAIIHHGGRSSSRQKVSQWSTTMKYRAMTRYYRKTRGRLYELIYRTTMACAAVGRLFLLGIAYLFGSFVWDRQSVRYAADKWKAVLKWAVGRQDLAL